MALRAAMWEGGSAVWSSVDGAGEALGALNLLHMWRESTISPFLQIKCKSFLIATSCE